MEIFTFQYCSTLTVVFRMLIMGKGLGTLNYLKETLPTEIMLSENDIKDRYETTPQKTVNLDLPFR